MATSDQSESARRVVLSYPDGLSEWSRDQLLTDRYRKYLRRAFEAASVGDEREEFVDVGCCGTSLEFTIRVEAVEGGDRIDETTDVELVERPGDVDGGWNVQSEAAPE